METALYWLTSVAALVGVCPNIQGHVACFWIWACTNAIWTYADATHGIYPQATLQAMYFLLALYGIWKWSASPPGKAARSRDQPSPSMEVQDDDGGSNQTQ